MAVATLRAGVAALDITPPLGTSLNGGMQDRKATHIHDPLRARALVLASGEDRLAIVVCDSCAIPGAIFDEAKNRVHAEIGFPRHAMLMSATHTHTAATVASVFQSDADLEYAVFLAGRIADAVRCAVNNLAPARIGWGAGQVADQVFNRRWRMKPGTISADPFGNQTDQAQMNPPSASPNLVEPTGPTDPEVSVLSVVSPDGRPIAALANYSLHYVGGTGDGAVSADYFAAFADSIQQQLGADWQDPPFVGIMSNGTSGNINNINFREPGTRREPYEQIQRVGFAVAQEAARVIGGIEYRDSCMLGSREARLPLGRRLPTADEVARAEMILSRVANPVLTTLEEVYARETVLLNGMPPTVETVVQAHRIGELGIVALPCEVFVETGLAIKRDSPLKPAFTIELANDYAGYLPTAEHHKLGGYETWRARSSFLEVGAEERIRTKALSLLAELDS